MRLRAKRDAVEPAIVAVLEAAGCSVARLNDPDLPDLLVGRRGITHLLEVKSGRGKMRPGQMKFALTWNGCPVRILRSAEEARHWVEQQTW